jgi:asparagine synthase (glutamine-hydrolysing)
MTQMSGLTGIFLVKAFRNASSFVQNMSRALQHRGCESIQQYNDPIYPERKAIIYLRSLKTGTPFVESKQTQLVIIDSLFPLKRSMKAKIIRNPDAFNTLSLKIDSAGLSVFRSIDGTRGFYYARLNEGIIFASERKSIWRVTRNNIDVLEPGQVLSVSWTGELKTTQLASLTSSRIQKSADRAIVIDNLRELLNASFKYIKMSQKCGVLFSGGVDSALAALLTMKECDDTLLVTAMCKDSHDEKAAMRAAEILMAKHAIVKIDDAAIWKALPEVIHSIETSDRMQVEIALPFFFAAREARRRGCDLVISGQGPDELFAGYARYETLMRKKGTEAVEEALAHDVSVTHESNLQRDIRAIAFHGLEVFFPYLYPPFIRAALALPATLKIDFSREPARKSIFRELAVDLGLPEETAQAPKRATQYSSGSSKLLAAAIRRRVDDGERPNKRLAAVMVQDVLDTIAYHLGIPDTEKIGALRFDLGPTECLQKKLEHSTSSN